MGVRWTLMDRLIADMRFAKVKPHLKENCILCDLGCGFDGAFLNSQATKIKKGYGFDKKVKNNMYDNIQLFGIDDLNNGVPLSDGTVDIVTMLALIEHLERPDKILMEAFRILKPQGKIILTAPSVYAKPVLEFMAFQLCVISAEEIRDHKQYYSNDQLALNLGKAGFKDIVVKNFMFGFNQIALGVK